MRCPKCLDLGMVCEMPKSVCITGWIVRRPIDMIIYRSAVEVDMWYALVFTMVGTMLTGG